AIDPATLDDDLNAMQQWMVGNTAAAEIDYGTYVFMANRLYQQLVRPYLTTDTERLILSPDGPLAFLPFETLTTGDDGEDFKTAPYLFRDVEMQYAYSANVLFRQATQVSNRRPDVLAMSYMDVDDLQKLVAQELQLDHSPLPFSDEEVEGIAKALGRKRVMRLKGPRASESAFKAHVADHDIVHLAIHGLGDTISGLNSHLVFRTDQDTLNDGLLYAEDVYGLQIDHLRMAVLSACETGVGKAFPGEGIFSIARGFAYAQTPTTVMSLWKVQDRVTAQIMQDFYRHLAQGKRVSAALREAKLAYLERTSDRQSPPMYWAPLVAYGEMSPVVPTRNRLLWWSGGVLLMVLIVGLWRKSRDFSRG
ncbi:MAG: CHAT domain-containing protein, partial [Saprospiraceae bacterium]|nr:CHAT domain-containing protein [Saprospiraceae bacterium]